MLRQLTSFLDEGREPVEALHVASALEDRAEVQPNRPLSARLRELVEAECVVELLLLSCVRQVHLVCEDEHGRARRQGGGGEELVQLECGLWKLRARVARSEQEYYGSDE